MSDELEENSTVDLLAQLNKLTVNACSTANRQALIFILLNDTIKLTHYDRAVLWDMDKPSPDLIGISNQTNIDKGSGYATAWEDLVKHLIEPNKIQALCAESFSDPQLWEKFKKIIANPNSPIEDLNVLWMPIKGSDKRCSAGLCLERWSSKTWEDDELDLLRFLAQGYSAGWRRYEKSFDWRGFIREKKTLLSTVGLFALALFFTPVPLRIVAPCEVVPKDPILVTAPLDGIISEIMVKPGENVSDQSPLFLYDKRVILQQLVIAQKQVDIIRSEYDRALASVFEKKDDAFSELAVLQLQLQKEMSNLELASYYASQVEVKSPEKGLVLMNNPEDWRGRPVRVGEKVLTVTNPKSTQVKIFVPEDDNIVLDATKNINVFLNVKPEDRLIAKINYISSESSMTEKGIPSFIAEADWLDPDADYKMGLKGTAVLYGNRVSLFYWMFRKPIAGIKHFIGL